MTSMDPDKLVVCTEDDFVEHRNALDLVNFDKLDALVDDDHLVIPTGKSFWESLNLVNFFKGIRIDWAIGDVGTSSEEKMDVCPRNLASPVSLVRRETGNGRDRGMARLDPSAWSTEPSFPTRLQSLGTIPSRISRFKRDSSIGSG